MVHQDTRRREGQRSNILDLVIISDENKISEIQHEPPLGRSDHDILMFSLYIQNYFKTRGRMKQWTLKCRQEEN